MKICLAQTKSDKGNIEGNIENHKKWIDIAIFENADLIVFPELSITGYEPELAKELATNQTDSRLDVFQEICNLHKIAICVGLPIKLETGISISMVIFQPNLSIKTYSKQILHSDEEKYFTQGDEQIILSMMNEKIAPAICYESLQLSHSEKSNAMGAKFYLASVAKSQSGIEKAFGHFPEIANRFSMVVLMVNCVGDCDNFKSTGQTSIWDDAGILIGSLDNISEGILIYDTEFKTITIKQKTNANNIYNL